MTKYLILGSSGFIGKNLCNYLKSIKCEVVEYDIKNDKEEDLRINNNSELSTILDSCDFVFFLAFDVGGSKFLTDSNREFTFLMNNTRIISNTFEVLKLSQKKFLFISSYLVQNLDHSYGILKTLGEHFTSSLGGLVVRLYNIYGHEEISYRSHVIPDLINQAKFHKKIKVNTNGFEERQFLHVDDCCEGLYKISQNYAEILKKNSILDLTSFEWTSVKNVAEMIGEILNSKIEFSKNDADYNIKCVPNEIILDFWKPKISISEGISKMIFELAEQDYFF